MTPQLRIALIRGIIQSVVIGGSTFFALAATTHDFWLLFCATGGAVFSSLAMRFGAEGVYDSNMAKQVSIPPVEIHPGGPQ